MISKAKSELWQKTCSGLFPKTHPSEVFLLHSVSGFPNSHTPVDCANRLCAHLQSHFSTQKPKPFLGIILEVLKKTEITEKAHVNKIRTTHCNTLHSTFCSPFSSLELSSGISQLSNSTSLGPDQITYPLLSSNPPSSIHATISSKYL